MTRSAALARGAITPQFLAPIDPEEARIREIVGLQRARICARELDARAQRVEGQRTLLRMRAKRRQRQQNQRCLQQRAW